MRGSPTAELFFDNVEIPEGNTHSRSLMSHIKLISVCLDDDFRIDRLGNYQLTDRVRKRSRRSGQRRQSPHVGS